MNYEPVIGLEVNKNRGAHNAQSATEKLLSLRVDRCALS
jgi:hypothetical protein